MERIEQYVNEEKLYQDFIYDFAVLRHKLGLTQVEMAKKSNVLRDKIAKIEAGIYPPNIKSIFKILGPLGYTIKIEKIDNHAYSIFKLPIVKLWIYYSDEYKDSVLFDTYTSIPQCECLPLYCLNNYIHQNYLRMSLNI